MSKFSKIKQDVHEVALRAEVMYLLTNLSVAIKEDTGICNEVHIFHNSPKYAIKYFPDSFDAVVKLTTDIRYITEDEYNSIVKKLKYLKVNTIKDITA